MIRAPSVGGDDQPLAQAAVTHDRNARVARPPRRDQADGRHDHDSRHGHRHDHGDHAGHGGHGGHGGHNGHGHGDHPPARPLVRLRQILRPERSDLNWIILFAVVAAILSLATPIAVEALVNTVSFGVLLWPVVVISLVLLGCLGLAAAIRAAQVYVVECMQRRLFVRVAADYARRLPRVQMESLDDKHGPELANRFFDVLNVQKAMATLLLDGVALLVTTAVGMVVLAFYHPFLLGFDVVLLLVMLFMLFVLGWGGVDTSLRESHAKYDVAGWLEELLRSQRTFKTPASRKFALEKSEELLDEYVAARRSHFKVVWRQTVFALTLQAVASTALLGLGGWLVIHRQLTLGQLVAAELIVSLVVASIAKLGKYAETYYDLLSGAEKLGVLTDLPLERLTGEPPPPSDEGIGVTVLDLSGPARLGVASQPDWRIAPNEHVAVLGAPGSGKTTLFEILCGLREPGRGGFEIDGIDVRALDPEAYREQAALVDHPEIVGASVADNLRMGRDALTATDLREALQAVGLLTAVHSLPQGLDTPLTPSGRPLSRSQALRLTIARAILGRPRLLILDGVLDGLDFADCPQLLPTLFDRAAPWTLLVVSQDPKILAMCDRTVEAPTVDAHPSHNGFEGGSR